MFQNQNSKFLNYFSKASIATLSILAVTATTISAAILYTPIGDLLHEATTAKEEPKEEAKANPEIKKSDLDKLADSRTLKPFDLGIFAAAATGTGNLTTTTNGLTIIGGGSAGMNTSGTTIDYSLVNGIAGLNSGAVGVAGGAGNANKYVSGDGLLRQLPANYTAGSGLTLSGNTLSVGNSGVTAGNYGGNIMGSTMIPSLTINSQGRITAATNINTGNLPLTGDITGTLSNNSLNKIQSYPLSISTPTSGQVLTFNGSSWVNDDLPSVSAGSATITNSLTSAVNSLTSDVNGVTSSANIINSSALTASGNTLYSTTNGVNSNAVNLINSFSLSTAGNQLAGSTNGVNSPIAQIINSNNLTQDASKSLVSTINGIATSPLALVVAGDVAGTLGALTVTKLQGTNISSNVPTDNQVLTYDSGLSVWKPSSVPGVTTGNLTPGNSAISIVGGSGAVVGTGAIIDIQNATASQNGLLTAADFLTFNNKVDTVFGRSGAVTALVGDYNTDLVTEGSTNQYFTAARADAQIFAQKGLANGLATLDGAGKVPLAQLPAISTGSTYVKNDLDTTIGDKCTDVSSAVVGDICIANAENNSYVLGATPGTVASNWIRLLFPATVNSVNGQTGTVTLSTDTVLEGTTNKYYSDARARNALSVAGTPLTYNSTTGVVGITQANTSTAGYLTAADWNIFNSKQSNSLASGKIFVGNSSNIATPVSLSGDITIDNTGLATLAAIIAGNKTFSGNTTLGGTLGVTGATTLTGTLTANGIINNTTLTQTGNSTFAGNITQSGNKFFSTGTGNVLLNGTTSVTGSNNFNVGTGTANLGGDLNVAGITNLGALQASGLASLSSLIVTNNADIGANLDVTGTTVLRNSLSQVGIAAPAPSSANRGTIYFDSTSGTFKVSQNGSAYTNLVAGATTNTLTSAANTLTSTVNGTAANASIINTVLNNSTANTLTTTINGVAGAGVNIINSNVLSQNGTNQVISTINGIASTPVSLTVAGDVSGNLNTLSVDKIKGNGVVFTSLANGNLIQYNGTNFVNVALSALGFVDLTTAQTIAGNKTFSGNSSFGGTVTISPFTTAGIVKNNASGLLSSGLVNLTTDVSGILPIANGGTGSATQNFVDLTTAQTVAGNKTFSGNTFVGGTLGVTGATTLTGALTTNGITNNTTLTQTGNATFTGNIAQTGAGTLSTGTGLTTINGTSQFNDNATIRGAKSLTFNNAANTFGTTLKAGANTANATFTLPTADGTSGQVLSTDGAGNLGFASVTGDSALKTLTYNENINAGDPIQILANGKVARLTASSVSVTAGTPQTIATNLDNTNLVANLAAIDSSRVVAQYDIETGNSSSNKIPYIKLGTVSGSTVTWGSQLATSTINTQSVGVGVNSDGTKGLAIVGTGFNAGDALKYVPFTIGAGTSATLGTAYTAFNAGANANFNGKVLSTSNANKVLATYNRTVSFVNNITYQVVDVSNTASLTTGTAVYQTTANDANGGTGFYSIDSLGNDKYMSCHSYTSNNNVTCQLISVNAATNVVSLIGSEVTFTSSHSTSEISVAKVDANTFAIFIGQSTLIVATVNTSTGAITYGTETVTGESVGNVQQHSILYYSGNSTVTHLYYDVGAGQVIARTFLINSGSRSINAANSAIVQTVTNRRGWSGVNLPGTTKSVGSFWDDSFSGTPAAYSVVTDISTAGGGYGSGYTGIAQTTAVSGATGQVMLTGGVSSASTGLTAGSLYYIDTATGTLTTTAGSNVLAGRAISATSLIIGGQGSSSSGSLSSLTAATSTNTIDNLNFGQTWNWSTATTQSGLALTANALTTGEALDVSSSSNALTAGGNVLNVNYSGTSVTGNIFNVAKSGVNKFTVGADGNTTIAGTTTLQNALSVTGAVAFRKGADYSTVGVSNDAVFASASVVRLTGASAQTITGIAGGSDGQMLTIINAATQAAIISNQNVGSIASNRITTGNGADLTLAANASITLVYDSGASLWRVIGGTGSSGSVSSIPTVTTNALSNTSATGFTSGGIVTGSGITAAGVVYNTAGSPTTANSKTTDTVSGGSFTSVVTGLAASTTYYVRAYATNSTGTTYGEQIIYSTGILSNTFNYTGAVQTYTVPANVTSVRITTVGAQGTAGGQASGLGGKASGTMAVTPGQVLNIYVGGQNGYNGGGTGYTGSGGTSGNGGGASDVRVGGTAVANRVIVAGGGGGSAYEGSTSGTGSGGGGAGTCGVNYCGGGGGNGYGFAGTAGGLNGGAAQTALNGGGGAGGGLNSGGAGAIASGGSGSTGGTGSLGQGGSVGAINGCSAGVAAGGGGYYGGGAAAGYSCGAGQGGGGSSWTGTLTSPTFVGATQSGNGYVSIDTQGSSQNVTGIATGATVDYINANLSSSQSISSNNTDIIFNQVASGNIPLDTATGVFTLTAGKTYQLTSTLAGAASAAGGFIGYKWVDASNNTPLANVSTGFSYRQDYTGTDLPGANSTLIYTPTTNQTIKVRTINYSNGPVTLYAQGSGGFGTSSASIVQIGSTTAYSGASNVLLSLSNFATGGTIGTAAATVDTYNVFDINQTTAGQTLTLPNPSNTTSGKQIIVNNKGTASFTMHSATISAGASAIFVWNGSQWNAISGGGSTSSNIVTITDKTTGGTIGTAAATVDLSNTFNVTQTTASQTLTLPTPTNATTGKTVSVNNTGSAQFTMYSTVISPGSTGVFSWNGTTWLPITTNGNGNVAAEFGEVNTLLTSTIATAATDMMQVTLPSAGNWQVDYKLQTLVGSTNTTCDAFITDNLNNIIGGSYSNLTAPTNYTYTSLDGSAQVTTTGSAVYKVRALCAGSTTAYNNTTEGSSKITFRKIAGYTPVTGQSADYGFAKLSTNQSSNINPGTDHIKFDSIAGNIVLDTATTYTSANNANSIGRFTLKAGKIYSLEAGSNTNVSPGNLQLYWRNADTGAQLPASNISLQDSTISSGSTVASAIYAPTADTRVEVFISSNTGPTAIQASNTYAKITQLGSSAVIAGSSTPFNTITSAAGTNTIDNGTYEQAWNWNAETTGNALTLGSSSLTTGNLLSLSGSNATQTGSNLLVASNSAGAVTNGLARFNFTGAYTGNGLQLDTATATGTGMAINANSLTSGNALAIGSSSTVATGSLANLTLSGNAATNTASGLTIGITGAASNAKGLTITNAGNGLSADIGGAIALRKGGDYSTVGSANNVNFGNTSLVRLTGASAQTITGILAGKDGQVLTIMNTAAQAATISNQSASSLAANRIVTGTGADLNLAAGASIQLMYDITSAVWRIVGGAGGSSSNIINIADKPTGGAIGTAAATVDISNSINITQTTASQTLTLPNPTNATGGNTVSINNTGSTQFTMYGIVISPGNAAVFSWNGTTWLPLNTNVTGGVSSEYGENTGITNNSTISSTSLSDVAGSSFTLPSAGTWKVEYNIYFAMNANNQFAVGIYDSSNAQVGNSGGATGNNNGYPVVITNSAYITTTGATTYKLRGATDVGGVTATIKNVAIPGTNTGNSKVTWQKISGYTPVTGQSVDYVYVTRGSTNQTVGSSWSNTDIIYNNKISGNIPFNTSTGVATLTAGKTYRITAGLSFSAAAVYLISYNLVDANTNAVISPTAEMVQSSNGTNNISAPQLDYVYTPSTNQTVKIRMTGGTNMQTGEQLRADIQTFMNITQLGSSAVIAGSATPFNTITSAAGTNSIDNGTFDQNWNWNAETTGNALSLGSTSLTTGNLLSLATTNAAQTGSNLLVASNSTGAIANGLARFNFTGAYTGNGLQLDTATATGTGQQITANSLTTGEGLNVTSSSNALTTGGNLFNADYTGSSALGNILNVGKSGTSKFAVGADGNTTLGGALTSTGMAAPAVSAVGTGRIYFDSTANVFKVSQNGGAFANLATTAGGVPISSLTAATAANTIDNLNFGQTWNWSTLGANDGLRFVTDGITSGNVMKWDSNVTASNFTGNNLFMNQAGNSATNTGTLVNLQSLGASNTIKGIQTTIGSTGAFATGINRFNFTGAYTGNGFQLDTATATGTGQQINASALTTGTGLGLTTGNATLNSTNGLLNVSNTGTSTNGTLARLQANSTAGSGLTVLTNGNVGIGTAAPTSALTVAGTTSLNGVTTVGGNTTISGANTFTSGTGANTFNGNTSVSGTNTFTVGTGATTLGGTLAVTGNQTNTGSLTVGTTLGVTGATTLSNSLTQVGMAAPAVSTAGQGRIYFDSTSNTFKVSQNGGAYSNLVGGTTSISNLTAATAANSIDNTNFAQTWNWSTTNTSLGLGMNFNGLTTGTGVVIASNNNSLNSTNGLLQVVNGGTSTSGTLARFQANSNAGSGLTVLNNGNVGIGSSTPTARLEVAGDGTALFANSTLFLNNTGTSGRKFAIGSRNDGSNGSRFSISDETASTERLTLTASGTLNLNNASGATLISGYAVASNQINAYSGQDALTLRGNGANNVLNLYSPQSTGTAALITFVTDNGGAGQTKGSITSTGATTSYNTTSDSRLKTNQRATHFTLDDLMKIEIKDYTIGGTNNQTGFIAQQLNTVYPQAVTVGGSDPLKNPWTVDYSKVTPLLVKGMQDLNQKVDALGNTTDLNNRLTAAETKVNNLTAGLGTLTTKVDSIDARVAALENKAPTPAGTASFDGGIVTQNTEFKGALTLDKTVTVNGMAKFLASAEFQDVLVKGTLRVKKDLNVEGNAKFAGRIVVSDDTAGSIKILKGETKLKIKFAKAQPNDKYVVSLTQVDSDAPSFKVTNKTKDSFEITIPAALATDSNFDWIVVGK